MSKMHFCIRDLFKPYTLTGTELYAINEKVSGVYKLDLSYEQLFNLLLVEIQNYINENKLPLTKEDALIQFFNFRKRL